MRSARTSRAACWSLRPAALLPTLPSFWRSPMRDEVLAHIAARDDILARLRHVLIDRLHLRREPDELDPDAPLFGSGFGLDSLDAVELVVCMENELGVRITDGAVLRQQ